MRLHSIFQEKKLLWSALLPDASNTCLEQLSQQGLLNKLEPLVCTESANLIQTKEANLAGTRQGKGAGNLEQKKLHITSPSNPEKAGENRSDIGGKAKKPIKQPFTSFFAVVSNGFFSSRQANKAKLQNAGSLGLALATQVPTANKVRASSLTPPLFFTVDENIPKGLTRLVASMTQAEGASNPNTQVSLVFSCFDKSDLNNALYLFQKYLTSLTNRLTVFKDFEKIIKSRDSSFSLVKSLGRSRLSTGGFAGLKQSVDVRSKGQANSLIGTKRQSQKVAGILRALRDLNQPFKPTYIPLSTQLYTVIRSPHVFKKTREQFAMTKMKRTVQLSFKSKAALRLLVDSLILLKLPAEVKVIIRDHS